MAASTLSRNDTVQSLRDLEPVLRAKGLRSLHLFGSIARNEATTASDVDVFAEFDPGARLGWDFAGVPEIIGRRLSRRVDFTIRGSLHPLLRADIEREAIRIF